MERASRDPVPDPGDELVDVVDEQDRVVATVTRREIRRENLRHRAVGIVVFDPRGRVLAHRRSDAKDVWPGRWDLAAGGVVASGEDYATAAARELAEELGVEGAELVHVGTGPYADDVVRSCCAYFTTVWG